MFTQRSSIARLSLPGIVPLELWDIHTPYGILWDTMRRPDFAAILLNSIEEIIMGKACSRSDGPLPSIVKNIDCVVVTGGGASPLQDSANWSSASIPIIFGEHGCFAGVEAAFSLLDETHTDEPMMAIDIGQTAIKTKFKSQTWRFERDLEQLPVAPPGEFWPHQRKQLREYISHAIVETANTCNATVPSRFLIALPCEISATGQLGGSSYGGMKGDETLISDVLGTVCSHPYHASLLNDGELAAYAAKIFHQRRLGRTTLSLTIGFAVGAALIIDQP